MHASRMYLFALALLALVAISAHGQAREIIVEGQDSPEWNQKLGVTATRGSCNLPPEGCIKTVPLLLASQHTSRFYLNIWDDLNSKTILERTAYYSQASLTTPGLYELDIDDFVDHFNGWCHTPGQGCDVLLGQIISATKSRNKALRFGVAIYEDQLTQVLDNPRFTPALRDQIDSVHLYLHQRQNGPEFESYVNQVGHHFSHAQVIAGAYHYDRIDYTKCGALPCTPAQELNYYTQTLKLQLTLLEHQVVNGIEFYPGGFGLEDKLSFWNDPRICAPARRQQCIDNTKAMDNATLELFKEFKIGNP